MDRLICEIKFPGAWVKNSVVKEISLSTVVLNSRDW